MGMPKCLVCEKELFDDIVWLICLNEECPVYKEKNHQIIKIEKPYLYKEKTREELVQLIEDKNLIISALCEKIRKDK